MIKGTFVKKPVSKKQLNWHKEHPSYVILEETESGGLVGFTVIGDIPDTVEICNLSEQRKCAEVLTTRSREEKANDRVKNIFKG